MIAFYTVPVKCAAGSCEKESCVVLLMPRYPTMAGKIVGRLLRRSKHIKVKLDDIGSETWRLVDGRRTVREIGEEIHGLFGDKAEPLYPRLVEFLNILQRNKFIMINKFCEVDNVD